MHEVPEVPADLEETAVFRALEILSSLQQKGRLSPREVAEYAGTDPDVVGTAIVRVVGADFRKAQRTPQESSVVYAKAGEQQTVPVRFRALADTSIADQLQRFAVFDQDTTNQV